MTDSDSISADYTLHSSELAATLGLLADDINLGSIVTYTQRRRREVGEFLVGSCICRDPDLQRSPAFIRWAAARTTAILGAIRE